jgi:hypothetical protein
MTRSRKELDLQIFEGNTDEIKWDYRLMTKKERKRFLQKKMIIQNNYETFVKQAKNEVSLIQIPLTAQYFLIGFHPNRIS